MKPDFEAIAKKCVVDNIDGDLLETQSRMAKAIEKQLQEAYRLGQLSRLPSEDACRKAATLICETLPETVTQQRATENATRQFYEWMLDNMSQETKRGAASDEEIEEVFLEWKDRLQTFLHREDPEVLISHDAFITGYKAAMERE